MVLEAGKFKSMVPASGKGLIVVVRVELQLYWLWDLLEDG